MLEHVLQWADGMLLLGLLCGAYRFCRGPTLLDRILAFDYISVCLIAFIAVYSIQGRTTQYLELILIFSLLGFTTMVGFMEALYARGGEE
ncbi:MAG: Na(+)/H(+) antiporter subunit F [Chlamydiia bacterium]|nr:Na(+)/H(+) antiporter subunit F [Chlamydiia bacterium]